MTHDDTDLPDTDLPDTDPDREPHEASPTAHLLAELALYGHRPGTDEPDPRPPRSSSTRRSRRSAQC
ncbi:MAG: hypothetical protein ACREE4_14055 [Stellaceae bacterium]